MTRPDNLHRLQHRLTRESVSFYPCSFDSFMDLDPGSVSESDAARDEGYRHKYKVRNTSSGQEMLEDKYTARCLLDYVSLWLFQGPAARDRPTFEDYLLSVISLIADYFAPDRHVEADPWFDIRPIHGLQFPIFDWSEVTLSGFPESGSFAQVKLQGHGHPALQRHEFDLARARIVREDDERQIKQMIKDALEAIKQD